MARNIKFLYVLADQLGNYKIGVSGNIDKRIAQLQPGCPTEITLQCRFPSLCAYKWESQFHQRFKDKQSYGEWYCLEDEDISFIAKMGVFETVACGVGE